MKNAASGDAIYKMMEAKTRDRDKNEAKNTLLLWLHEKNIPPGEKVTIVVVSKERLIDFFLGVDNKLCVDLLKRNMSRLNGFLNMLPIFIYNNADWGQSSIE